MNKEQNNIVSLTINILIKLDGTICLAKENLCSKSIYIKSFKCLFE